VREEARRRRAEGWDFWVSERLEAARVMRCSVTVERQSTTVPKTSKRRALVVGKDIMGI